MRSISTAPAAAPPISPLPPSQWAFFQICDAPRARPDTEEELLFQARRARLAPGRGGLDLVGMLRALPADFVISIEAPMHGHPDLLPPVERARLLREATLDVLKWQAAMIDARWDREADFSWSAAAARAGSWRTDCRRAGAIRCCSSRPGRPTAIPSSMCLRPSCG